MNKHFSLNYIASCTTIGQSLAIISVQSGRFCLYHFTLIRSPILATPLLGYVFSPVRSVLFIFHAFHQFWSQPIDNYALRTGHVLSFSVQHAIIALWCIRMRQNSDYTENNAVRRSAKVQKITTERGVSPQYVKKACISQINQSWRLAMDLLVANASQRRQCFTGTAFILLAIKALSFVCCLQEPAWQLRHTVANN